MACNDVTVIDVDLIVNAGNNQLTKERMVYNWGTAGPFALILDVLESSLLGLSLCTVVGAQKSVKGLKVE